MGDEKNKINYKKDPKDESVNTKKSISQKNIDVSTKNISKNEVSKKNVTKKSKFKFYRIFCFQMIICFFILTFLLIIRIIPTSKSAVIKQHVKKAVEGKNFESFLCDAKLYFTKVIGNFMSYKNKEDEEDKEKKEDKKEKKESKDEDKTKTNSLKINKDLQKNNIDQNVIIGSENEVFKLYSVHDEDDLTCFNFKKPLKGEVSSRYGIRKNPFLKGKSDFHRGVDISANDGTPVVAIADGVVKLATKSARSGNYILIKHADDYESLYAHCSKLLVPNGKSVKKGDKIALSGHTGKVTGAHLHLGIKKNGNWIDPMQVFPNFL